MDPFASQRLLRQLVVKCWKSRFHVSLFPQSYHLSRLNLLSTGRHDRPTGVSRHHNCQRPISLSSTNFSDALRNGQGEKEIRDKIVTVPNLLCFSRIGLSPVIAYLILTGSLVPACGTLAVAGLTDLLDGFIARSFPSQQSAFGTALDPLADKVLITSVFLSLTYVQLMPWPLTALIIGRDVLLLSGGFYVRFISLPTPKTLRRYFDPTVASAKMFPTDISKVNTAVQLVTVGLSLAAPLLNCVDSLWLQLAWWTTGVTTIWSGLSYVLQKNNTYEVLNRRSEDK